MTRRLAGAFLITIAAATSFVCGPAVSDHDNRIFATPASIKLSAADLSAAYASDAGAADGRYRGRVLEISGVIDNVNPRGSVMLAGGENGAPVEASLHEDVAAAMIKTLAERQRVTLKCFCEGLSQQVRLKSCVAPDPARQ